MTEDEYLRRADGSIYGTKGPEHWNPATGRARPGHEAELAAQMEAARKGRDVSGVSGTGTVLPGILDAGDLARSRRAACIEAGTHKIGDDNDNHWCLADCDTGECPDCGEPTFYNAEPDGWYHHIDPREACFLIGADVEPEYRVSETGTVLSEYREKGMER